MSIQSTVIASQRVGADLHLVTEREPHLPREEYVIRDATVEPQPGDALSFGCAGVVQEDGTVFGGRGFIAMDGEEVPYRRVGANTLVQDWPQTVA